MRFDGDSFALSPYTQLAPSPFREQEEQGSRESHRFLDNLHASQARTERFLSSSLTLCRGMALSVRMQASAGSTKRQLAAAVEGR